MQPCPIAAVGGSQDLDIGLNGPMPEAMLVARSILKLAFR
jgi:hypothetical protein